MSVLSLFCEGVLKMDRVADRGQQSRIDPVSPTVRGLLSQEIQQIECVELLL